MQDEVAAMRPNQSLPFSRGSSIAGFSKILGTIQVGTWIKRGLLSIALLMTFRIFQFFPGMQYVQEAWFGFCWLIFLLAYFPWKLSTGLRFSTFEVYVLILMFAGIVLPSWGAWREFRQPVAYGMLAERSVGLLGMWLLMLNALRRRLIALRDIEVALLVLTWGTFALFCLMRLALSPARFASYGPGFIADSGDGIVIFKLPPYFILYGVIYYALRGFRTRRMRYQVAAAILFLFGAMGLTERWLTVSMGLTLLIFLFRWRRVGEFVTSLAVFACLALLGLAATMVVHPQFLTNSAARFTEAFLVVSTGTAGTDNSANARMFESVLVFPYIQKHPLLGNGVLSNQWQGGGQQMLGAYFYGTDIGLVGIAFSYGLFGILLFSWQYRFALRSASALPPHIHNSLRDATLGFLLFTALNSLTTGLFVWYAEITLFFVALLVAMKAEAQSLLSAEARLLPAIAKGAGAG
ncbi:MAG: hypothetical protein WCC27_20530 [Acidobacteriaceae bacterium]